MIRVIGFGMGPQHVTPEAAAALRASSYVVAFDKGGDDPLLAARFAVCREYGEVPLVALRDPARDRDAADYDGAVHDWHAARVAALRAVLSARDGDPALLVWGDPSLYDSTLRLVAGLGLPVSVVPG